MFYMYFIIFKKKLLKYTECDIVQLYEDKNQDTKGHKSIFFNPNPSHDCTT